jgi:hypothetical protein
MMFPPDEAAGCDEVVPQTVQRSGNFAALKHTDITA